MRHIGEQNLEIAFQTFSKQTSLVQQGGGLVPDESSHWCSRMGIKPENESSEGG